MAETHRKKKGGYKNVPSSSSGGDDGVLADDEQDAPQRMATSWRPPLGKKHVQLVPTEDLDANHDGIIRADLLGRSDPQQGDTLSSKLRRRSTIKKDALAAADHDTEFPTDRDASHESPQRIAPAVYVFATCAAWNSCILGYDIGVNALSVLLVQKTLDLSDVQVESYLGALDLFGILGAATASMGHQYLGRRGAFVVASGGFLLGDLIQATAQSYTVLMFGRAILGVSVGYGLAIDPMYISEIAPAHKRGELVSWSEIAINIGVIFGLLLEYFSKMYLMM